MARKSKRKKSDPIDAALALAARQGWRDTSLEDIAAEASLDLDELRAQFPSKRSLVAGFVDRIDDAMTANLDPELHTEPARDRLFDLIMRRLDALRPHREGIAAIAQASLCDACALIAGGCRLRRSLALMLDTAGLDAPGLRGAIRLKAVGAVYLCTLRAFMKDENEDLGQTMAVLDKALDRLDSLAAMVVRGGGRRAGADEPEEAPA
jgi:AcrR family transcriptional regulator